VVEIWPGGGWYTEILAPYLASGGGRLILATPDGQIGGVAKLRDAHPRSTATSRRSPFPPSTTATARARRHRRHRADVPQRPQLANGLHARRQAGLQRRGVQADLRNAEARRNLGIVDHRLPEDASDERERNSGYIKESTVKRLAEQAGFQLVAESDVNANPKDTRRLAGRRLDPAAGLRLKDQDRDKYLAIGESDRMTLKFVKPAL
jgi:predicted methyltransferase